MELSDLIKTIDQLSTKLSTLLPMSEENKTRLDKKIRLEFHYNTNHLEGNTLTYSETELLLVFDETRGKHTGRELEEMKASDVALQLVEELSSEKERRLNETFIKNLNQVLLVRIIGRRQLHLAENKYVEKLALVIIKHILILFSYQMEKYLITLHRMKLQR